MNKNGLLYNLFWKFSERIATQVVSFVVAIIIARILQPSDYGLIAIVMAFIAIADVLVIGGFGSSLIQKKDADDLDFSSVFIFNLILSGILYIVLYIISPHVSHYFGSGYESLELILKVLGIRIIISGIGSVQNAYISRRMEFKKNFYSTVIGIFSSAIVGLVMAYHGYGVWALVYQSLVNSFVNVIILALIIDWRPQFLFSVSRLRSMFSYGWKLLVSSLLISLYENLQSLVIGKFYKPSDLAYYARGKQFPGLLTDSINYSMSAVLFPKMATQQKDINFLKGTTRSAIRFGTFFMFPILLGLIAIAKTLILLLLTEKWLPCVPYLQLFCLVYIFYPIHIPNLQAIKAIGRSDIFLDLEVIKKIIEVSILLYTVRFGVLIVTISMVVISFFFTLINTFPNRRLLNYNYLEQMKDVLPNLVMSIFMAIVVYFVGWINLPLQIKLVLQILIGIIVYALLAYSTRSKEFFYIITRLKLLY